MPSKQKNYLALLRGINVGGNNIIPMIDLKECFAAVGFKKVRTYIQSGNVLFQSGSSNTKQLTSKIEKALTARFSYSAKVVVLSDQQFFSSLENAHPRWGKSDGYKHNAMFAIDGLEVGKVLDGLPKINRKIETVSYSKQVIFWSAKMEKINQTTMMKLAKSPAYKQLTVRNHNTTFKLAEMLKQCESGQ